MTGNFDEKHTRGSIHLSSSESIKPKVSRYETVRTCLVNEASAFLLSEMLLAWSGSTDFNQD